MSERTPLARELTTRPADTLELRPDDSGLEVALGVGATPDGEWIPLVHLTFHDADAGSIQVTLDTRTGHIEQAYGRLKRLMHAIHEPDKHPQDAAEVEAILDNLIRRAGQDGDNR